MKPDYEYLFLKLMSSDFNLTSFQQPLWNSTKSGRRLGSTIDRFKGHITYPTCSVETILYSTYSTSNRSRPGYEYK